jgi:predicted HicB family RNase H-like nuclease
MMTYKGYTASVEVDTEAGILFGRVLESNSRT